MSGEICETPVVPQGVIYDEEVQECRPDDGTQESPPTPTPQTRASNYSPPDNPRNAELVCQQPFQSPSIFRNQCSPDDHDYSLDRCINPRTPRDYRDVLRQSVSSDETQQHEAQLAINYARENRPEELIANLRNIDEQVPPEEKEAVRAVVAVTLQEIAADPSAPREVRREAVAVLIGTSPPPSDLDESGPLVASNPLGGFEGDTVSGVASGSAWKKNQAVFVSSDFGRNNTGEAPTVSFNNESRRLPTPEILASGHDTSTPDRPTRLPGDLRITAPTEHQSSGGERPSLILPLSPRTYNEIIPILLQVFPDAPGIDSPTQPPLPRPTAEPGTGPLSDEARRFSQFFERLREQGVNPEEIRRGVYGILQGLTNRGGVDGFYFSDSANRYFLQIGFAPERRELSWRFLARPVPDEGARLERTPRRRRFAGSAPTGPGLFGLSADRARDGVDGAPVVFVPPPPIMRAGGERETRMAFNTGSGSTDRGIPPAVRRDQTSGNHRQGYGQEPESQGDSHRGNRGDDQEPDPDSPDSDEEDSSQA